MAIERWTYDFENVDEPKQLLTVVGTRTDGLDVRTYRLPGTSVDKHDQTLATIRDTVAVKMRQMYLDDIGKETKLAEMLAGWADALATATNALEVE